MNSIILQTSRTAVYTYKGLAGHQALVYALNFSSERVEPWSEGDPGSPPSFLTALAFMAAYSWCHSGLMAFRKRARQRDLRRLTGARHAPREESANTSS